MDIDRFAASLSKSTFVPVTLSIAGITSLFSCSTTYDRMSSVMTPSGWYGTWSITIGHLYSCLSSSNHFMNVKQPVYDSSSRSGSGSLVPVGPMLPFFIMPMSHFTYVHTSSECPLFSASAM